MDVTNSRRIPLYQHIFDTIKGRIGSNAYPPGSYMPSERELCEEFKVHRITIRKSLDMLMEEGLVKKYAGKGTLVSDTPKPDKLRQNKNASPLSGQKYIVFVLCSDELKRDRFTEPFQSGLFYHLERRCAKLGYHLIYKTATKNDHIADIITGLDVSYVIFSSHTFEHLLTETFGLHIPALIVNHQYPQFISIQCDNFSAAKELVSYLIAAGHRRIAVLTGPQNYDTSRERLSGWKSALREHSLNYKHMLLYEGDWSFGSGYAAGKKIADLPKNERPDAVFAFNDESAFGVIKALQESGVSVPRDISVAGFDDIAACAQINPALSTVHVDISTIATAIIQQLYFALQVSNKTPVIHIRVPARLVIRDSIANRRLSNRAKKKEAEIAAERTG
jgi:DNA-binding LacI/PurR family transcriptional regulator